MKKHNLWMISWEISVTVKRFAKLPTTKAKNKLNGMNNEHRNHTWFYKSYITHAAAFRLLWLL